MMMLKILIVDDDLISRELMIGLLEDECSLDVVDSGEEAIRLASFTEYALIILDIQMPKIDGYAVARQIKGFNANEDTPIIFISAMMGEEVLKKAYSIGAVDFIAKGFFDKNLKVKVRSYCINYINRKRREEKNKIKEGKKRGEFLRELCASISHDFNNAVTPAMGNIMLAKMKTKEEGVSGDLLQLITEAEGSVRRMAELIKMFSGCLFTDIKYSKIDLGESIRRGLANKTILSKRCILEVDEHLWNVYK